VSLEYKNAIKNYIANIIESFFLNSCTTQDKPTVKISPYKYQADSEGRLPIVYVSFIFTINRPQAKILDTRLQMYKELEISKSIFSR
jgi:hypothetical protein